MESVGTVAPARKDAAASCKEKSFSGEGARDAFAVRVALRSDQLSMRTGTGADTDRRCRSRWGNGISIPASRNASSIFICS